MRGNLGKQGHYELFETTKGHQILNLNDADFYAVVEGQKGDILVHSNPDHEKKKTLGEGKFFLADFEDDPEFNDIPHLFLEEGRNRYREWILPNGTPSQKDHEKKLVRTDNQVGEDKVKYHTEGGGKKGREKQYRGKREYTESRAEASGKSAQDNLGQKTKDELYHIAQQKNIEGRSAMNKKDLIRAIGKSGAS